MLNNRDRQTAGTTLISAFILAIARNKTATMTMPSAEAAPQRELLSVATLRRSSPSHHSPTRVLQLTEQEHMPAPVRRITIESLQQRPRSNQRNRTPLRNESPLDPDEFRRRDPSESRSASAASATEGRRITIRPGAGGAAGAPMRVGTIARFTLNTLFAVLI